MVFRLGEHQSHGTDVDSGRKADGHGDEDTDGGPNDVARPAQGGAHLVGQGGRPRAGHVQSLLADGRR